MCNKGLKGHILPSKKNFVQPRNINHTGVQPYIHCIYSKNDQTKLIVASLKLMIDTDKWSRASITSQTMDRSYNNIVFAAILLTFTFKPMVNLTNVVTNKKTTKRQLAVTIKLLIRTTDILLESTSKLIESLNLSMGFYCNLHCLIQFNLITIFMLLGNKTLTD